MRHSLRERPMSARDRHAGPYCGLGVGLVENVTSRATLTRSPRTASHPSSRWRFCTVERSFGTLGVTTSSAMDLGKHARFRRDDSLGVAAGKGSVTR